MSERDEMFEFIRNGFYLEYDCGDKKIRYVPERTTTRNGKFKTKYGRQVPLCELCGYAIGDDRYNYCPNCGAQIVEAVKR